MKTFTLLSLSGAAAASYGSIGGSTEAAAYVDPGSTGIHQHYHQDGGICGSPLLRGSFSEPQDPICLLATASSPRSSPEANNAGSPWSFSKPCAQNGTSEYCVFTSTTFANNRGISIVTKPERAEYLATLPPFTNPDLVKNTNTDLDPDYNQVYEWVQMPGKGVGLVARKTIEPGDHIMSNTASIMVDYGALDSLPQQQVLEFQALGADRLPTQHRVRFMNMSTHSQVDSHFHKVDRILSTNAFDIDMDDDDEDSFFVVFPEIARMNHDCRPNADYHFDPDTLTQHVHAVRRINIGEEITVSYIDPMQKHAARDARLSGTWGFGCGCSMCQQREHLRAESDSRVAQIMELRSEFRDFSPSSRATPQMGELMVSLYEQDRLDVLLYEAHTYAAIEWNGAGEPWLAVKHARLAVEHGLGSVGHRDTDVIEMKALIRDPFKHWSWMLRTTKRMGGWKKKEAR